MSKKTSKKIIESSETSSETSSECSSSSTTVTMSEEEIKVLTKAPSSKAPSSKSTSGKSECISKKSSKSPPVKSIAKQELPALYCIDSKGKERVWKVWIVGNTIYREYGLVSGKKITNERTFEGKSIGKKNETTPEEQAIMEANKDWTAHINKEYLPKDTDKEGQRLLKLLTTEKQKSGGHCGNSVAAISEGKACKTKNVSRQKSDTFMVDTVQGGDVIPMKAQVLELDDPNDPHSISPKVAKYFSTVTGKGKNMKLEPTQFYSQAKYDGIRCRIMMQKSSTGEREIVMTTNSGKQLPWFESIRNAVLDWLKPLKNLTDLLDGLDGELYATEFVDTDGTLIPNDARFSTISSICGLSRSNPHPLEDQMGFYCFDLFDKSSTLTQVQRFECLDRLFKKLPSAHKKKIIKAETKIFDDLADIVEYHHQQVELGYEGIILRTFGLKYKTKSRSPELRKFKMFKDEEYEIIGVKLDKGVATEQFVWLLKTEDGKEFSAKPVGTKQEKLDWYEHRKTHIGKYITIKYQELSDEGVPRFPIAKSFRSGIGTD